MKKILFALVALTLLSAAFASDAMAAPKSASHGHTVSAKAGTHSVHPAPNHAVHTTPHKSSVNHVSFAKTSNYHLSHGTKFSGGYSYKGKNHRHWTQRRWDSRYGCECYFDPCCSVWYYWCEPDYCYYPVTYCPYRTYCWTVAVVRSVCEAQPVCTECSPPVVTEQVRTVRYTTTNVYRTTRTQFTTVQCEEGCPQATTGRVPSIEPPLSSGPLSSEEPGTTLSPSGRSFANNPIPNPRMMPSSGN